MNKPRKPTIEQLRAGLNRLFTIAKKLAETPEDYRALDRQESEASKQLLNELIRGDDDGEWIRPRIIFLHH
jgi:hypothetical protein